ncbi:hypothetical protein BHE74_00057137, partial [Ensete ventricosum]
GSVLTCCNSLLGPDPVPHCVILLVALSDVAGREVSSLHSVPRSAPSSPSLGFPSRFLGAILDGPPCPHSKRHADRFGVQHVPLRTRVTVFPVWQLTAEKQEPRIKTMIAPRTPLHLLLMEHDNNV